VSAQPRLRAEDPLHGLRATFVLNWASLGGAERRALSIASWLAAEKQASVEVLALTELDGRAVEAAREHGIPWRRISIEWGGGKIDKARDVAKLARALRAGKPDILMPFCSMPNVLCGLVWRWTGAATCIWHQADVSPFTRVRPSTRQRAVGGTPVFVSNSEHGADHLVHEWRAPRERIRVVRAGIDAPSSGSDRADSRSRLGIGQDDFVACMIAHFRKSKDHATLLRAWRIVADALAADDRRAVLLLAGESYPMGDAAKALAFDLRLDEAVQFVGVVSEVSGLLAASDVGVLSSFREGFPVSVLEAMVVGLPVAGTDIAGIQEAVGPSGYGFLAPLEDEKALAEAILRLARDPKLRSTVGAANRERVLTQFSNDRMARAYSDVLTQALASGRRASR
jgi:glycosyltransferase involved in cell wall biosynthesis